MNTKKLQYLKKNSNLLSIIIQFYEFLIDEIETDDYLDKASISKKKN